MKVEINLIVLYYIVLYERVFDTEFPSMTGCVRRHAVRRHPRRKFPATRQKYFGY